MATASVKIARETTTTRKPVATRKSAASQSESHQWSHRGIALTCGLSVVLNAHANLHHMHASLVSTAAILPLFMGVVIPCLVYIFARVAGTQWRRKARVIIGGRRIPLAAITAFSAVGLLGLSIEHCATSLTLLAGMSGWQAYAMAIAIDGGLVACELDVVLG